MGGQRWRGRGPARGAADAHDALECVVFRDTGGEQ